MGRLNVAIIGTGKLGTDLLVKATRSQLLRCAAFIGRNQDSEGIQFAKKFNIPTSIDSFNYLEKNANDFDLIFDVTNANFHIAHQPLLKALGKKVIDLTPSRVGHMVVPVINIRDAEIYDDISLISCGGQTALPIIHVLTQVCEQIDSIEVISSIASKSAGPATRINLDEYIDNTESALSCFSGCKNVKSVLILNPAEPEVNMSTTIYAEIDCKDLSRLHEKVIDMVQFVQAYVPGYKLSVAPSFEGKLVQIMLQVKGRGDFLPCYAGNLDIINCAAIQIAEKLAMPSRTSVFYAQAAH